MFDFKPRNEMLESLSNLSDSECKYYAEQIFTKRLTGTWIEQGQDKVLLHSYSTPQYDEPYQDLITQYFDNYRELLSKSPIYLRQPLLEGHCCIHSRIITDSASNHYSNTYSFEIYEKSRLLVSEKVMESIGLKDWVLDFYKNKTMLQFYRDIDKKDLSFKTKDDVEQYLDNQFKETLKKYGKEDLLEKEVSNDEIDFEEDLDEIEK